MSTWMNAKEAWKYPKFPVIDVTTENGMIVLHLACGHTYQLTPLPTETVEMAVASWQKNVATGVKHVCFSKEHNG